MKSSSKFVFLLIFAFATVWAGFSSSDAAPKTLVSVAVTPTNPSIALGTTEQFTAIGTYSDSSTRKLTTSVSWSSSDGSVATISNAGGSRGKATPVGAGTTTITATSGSISGSTTLTITALVSIAVNPTSPSIGLKTTEQFTATGTYSDNSTQNLTTSVSWSSSVRSVATISNAAGSKGKATSKAAGTTTITATSGNISGSTTLTVTPATLLSIAVTPSNPSVVLGTTQQFTAIGTYSDNSTQNLTTSVNWSSSAGSVATISNAAGSNGRATSVAVGTTTITATSGNISGSTTLTVSPATLVSIAVTPSNPSVVLGRTQQFTAIGTYSDNSTQSLTTSVSWSSSAGSVATISNTAGSNGRATSVATGATTITATSGNISGSTTLTVTPATLLSIAVTPANPSITLGTTQQFTAIGTYSDNSTQNLTTSVNWSSSAGSVATISNTAGSNGRATSVAAGTTTITATSGNISGSTTLTVTPATLLSIAVTPANPSITLGTTQQFTAIGTYSDNSTQNLTTSVSWSSSAGSVATISNAAGSNGRATSVATGTTTITATSGNISGSTTLTVTPGSSVTNNVLSITVNGSLCSTNSYLNKPCVGITVCTPGTSTCQTIDDILLDTGSFGVRIFKQVLNVSLVQASGASGPLAECVQFGDGSSVWGPVQIASVILGNEPAVPVPIQVIDSTFGTLPAACRNADPTPAAAGFNGILGVGLFTQDCGSACASSARNGMYYSCNGSICTGTSVSLSNQVQNPVALLPQDNNGVIVQLPSIPGGGSPSVNGNLVLGIGTQSNNVPSGVTAYAANQVGEIMTSFNGKIYGSFIDSGSNGLFFAPPLTSSIPNCPSPDSAWFCPSSTTSLSATNTGAFGSPSGIVSFQIGNFMSLINSFNNVFADIGGNWVGGFDWGLPFFFGRDIHFGFEGSVSSLGSGPCFAY